MARLSTAPSDRGRLELLLGAITALGPLAVDLYLPGLPAIGADLGAGPDQVQLTLSAYFAGAALGQLGAGPVVDAIGRRRPVLIGLTVFVVASLGCALATSVTALAGWRFVQALGGAGALVVPRAIVRDVSSGTEAARMMSRLVLVMGVAPIVAPLLGGWLLVVSGWRALFLVLAVAGAAAALASAAWLPETGTPSRRDVRADVGAVLRDPVFVRHTAVAAIAQASMFAYIAGSPFVFVTLHGIPPEQYGWLFGANALGFVTLSQVNRALLRRFRPDQVLPAALAVGGLGGALLLTTALTGVGGLPAIIVGLFVAVSSLGGVLPNATALALDGQGRRAGLASAVMGGLQLGAAAVASWAVSALHDDTALPMAAVVTACGVGAGIVYLATRRRA